jgi:rare lipoprotein A (peptidoglycan hydrolase)
MKYLFLLIPIYVFFNLVQIKEAGAKTPQNKVEVVHPSIPSPSPTPGTSKTLASWYDRSACQERIYGVNCKTADGTIFDESKDIIACARRFRLGSRIRLCYLDKCVDAVCGDRGNFERFGRSFDLTPSTFGSLADLNKGVIEVEYKVLDKQMN